MNEIFSRYGIDPALSVDGKLTLLEKERQKLLRKLNHVFGEPEKEKKVSDELDAVEAAMSRLEQAGGRQLSMDSVKLEVRNLSQTQLVLADEEEEMDASEQAEIAELIEIRRLQKQVLDDGGADWNLCVPGIQKIVDYYETRGSWVNMEKWLIRGSQWVPHQHFLFRLYRLYCDPSVSVTEDDRFYWTRRAADMGEKGACFAMGQYLTKKERFDLQKAGYYFAKAAGDEYPDAYIQAFRAYYSLKDYKRAEICLKAALKKNVTGAAFCMGAMYFSGNNPEGREDYQEARIWFEKAYREAPDGNVCYTLANCYILEHREEDARRLLKEGAEIYQDEDCEELYQELLNG